jgi:hypothetical protein
MTMTLLSLDFLTCHGDVSYIVALYLLPEGGVINLSDLTGRERVPLP